MTRMNGKGAALFLALVALSVFGFDCANNPPALDDVGDQVVTAGQTLTVQLAAVDPDGDALTYYAENLPAGSTFDADTGLFEYTPGFFDLGHTDATFGVSDGELTDEETVAISVEADTDFVAIELRPASLFLMPGQTAELTFVGIRADGTEVEGIYVNIENPDAEVAYSSYTGEVTAVDFGTATVEAWLVSPETLSATAEVVVGADLAFVNGAVSGVGIYNTATGDAVIDTGADSGVYANAFVVDGDRAYIVSSGDNTIRVIDTLSLDTVQTIDLTGIADNPWDIAVAGDSKAYVSGLFTDTLAVLDTETGGVVATIDVPTPGPYGATPTRMLVYDGRLFVACQNIAEDYSDYGPGFVAVLDTATDTWIDTDADAANGVTPIVTSQKNPGDLALSTSGTLFVVNSGDWSFAAGTFSNTDAVDPDTYAILATVEFGDYSKAGTVSAAPSGVMYFGENIAPYLYSVDGQTFEALRTYAAGNYVTVPNSGGYCLPSPLAFKDGVAYGLEYNSDHLFAFDPSADNGVDPIVFTTDVDLTPEAGDWVGASYPAFLN